MTKPTSFRTPPRIDFHAKGRLTACAPGALGRCFLEILLWGQTMHPVIAVIRERLAQLPLIPSTDYAALRARMEAFGATRPLPEGAQVEATTLNGVPGERVIPPDMTKGRAILYLHGGGYVIGSPGSHRALVAQLAGAAGAEAYLIDYPLAPEHPFPAALDATVSAYQALIEQGQKPANLVIAGDSAGGGLTLATALKLRDSNLPLPAGLFCMSPWADLTLSGDSHRTHASRDPMVVSDDALTWAEAYAGPQRHSNPLASPAKGDFAKLPPVLIHVGSEEVLLSDSLMAAARAGEAGIECTLFIAPEMIHVWQYFPMLTEAHAAIASAGLWIKSKTVL
jgi:acetyl esterase/lipase